MINKRPDFNKALLSFSRYILSFAGIVLSVNAAALGVGDISLHSKLGQPLSADIKLMDADELTEYQLIIAQAPPAIYQQMGIERSYLSNDIIITRTDSNTVSLTTRKPIKEPYLNFVLRFSWPDGEVVKEFKLLVDPE